MLWVAILRAPRKGYTCKRLKFCVTGEACKSVTRRIQMWSGMITAL